MGSTFSHVRSGLLTKAAQHYSVMKKNNKPFTFNKFFSTPPHSTLACVRGDEARTAAAVIVNWIKLKKDLFQRAIKKNNKIK